MSDNFEFAVDIVATVNSLSATYSCRQMDAEWVPQEENELHSGIQINLLLWISKLSRKAKSKITDWSILGPTNVLCGEKMIRSLLGASL